MEEPQTESEWQEAVDLADFYLHLHAAVAYGLVTYTGEINVERCQYILQYGRDRNITPHSDAVERITRRLGEALGF
jgi:hypothetical protein